MTPAADAIAFAIAFGLIALFVYVKWRDYRQLADGIAQHGVEAPPFSEIIVDQIGRYVRFAFFATLLIGGLAVIFSAEAWQLYTRPIGGMILLDILGALLWPLAMIVALIAWARWAFWSERNYSLWAGLAMIGVLLLALSYLGNFLQPRQASSAAQSTTEAPAK